MKPAMLEAVHPVLMARDVRASVEFFKLLGFALAFTDTPDTPTYAVITRDLCELHLQWQGPSQWDGQRDRPTYRFLVADVDRLFQEFQAAGAAPDPTVPASPWAFPANTPWSTREFHLKDPAGNGLQFYRLV